MNHPTDGPIDAAGDDRSPAVTPGISLGISRDDGHEVPFAAGRGRNLLVIGDYGCGKTWALKRLSYRLCRAGEPVAVFTPIPQGYDAVAEALGGVAYGPEGPEGPDGPPRAGYLSIEGAVGDRAAASASRAGAAIGDQLDEAPLLPTDGLGAIFVDAADAFFEGHLAGALLRLAEDTDKEPRVVVAVTDPESLCRVETPAEYRWLLKVLEEWDILVMSLRPDRVSPLLTALTFPSALDPERPGLGPRPRAKKDRPAWEAAARAHFPSPGVTAMQEALGRAFAGHRAGEGLLLRARGSWPVPLYVDTTEEEARLFDARVPA